MTMLGDVARGVDKAYAAVVEGIKANGNAKVLVVGCRGDNFPEEYRQHAQLLFWDGDDAPSRVVPAAVHLILTTRFVSHPGLTRLKEEARRRNIPFVAKALGTGEVKTILAPLMAAKHAEVLPPVPPKPVLVAKPAMAAAPVPEPELPKQFKKGTPMVDFITRHNGDPLRKPYIAEAARLFELARSEGYATTLQSVKQALYVMRTGHEPEPPAVEEESAPEPTPAPVVPAAVARATVDDDKELLQMIQDVEANLARALQSFGDVGAALALIRERVNRRYEARKKLKALLEEL